MLGKYKRHVTQFFSMVLVLVISALAANPAAARVDPVPYDYSFNMIFGLATAPDGSLLVADGGTGIVELRNGEGNLVAALPGVSDVAPIGRGSMFVITGGGFGEDVTEGRLFRVSRDEVVEIANLGDFEETVNPDQNYHPDNPEINPNPFDVEALTGGKALVADAGGNSLLIVDMDGNIDWVATLPEEVVSTANGKIMLGCPNPFLPDFLATICNVDEMPAQAVATSIAIGPDGAYYLGELKGIPAPVGESRIWRVEPGTIHADCATSPACTVVADGFTSIVDLTFGPDGTLYVVEMDEASWFGMELGLGEGGTLNACDTSTWICTEVATDLPIPTAAAVDGDGTVYSAILALIPGAAQVIKLP